MIFFFFSTTCDLPWRGKRTSPLIYQEEVKDPKNWTEILAFIPINNQTGSILHSFVQLLLSLPHWVLFRGPSPRFCSYWPSLISATVFKLISELNTLVQILFNELHIVRFVQETNPPMHNVIRLHYRLQMIRQLVFSFTCPGDLMVPHCHNDHYWELVNLLGETWHPLCNAGLLSWLLIGHVSQCEVDSCLRILCCQGWWRSLPGLLSDFSQCLFVPMIMFRKLHKTWTVLVLKSNGAMVHDPSRYRTCLRLPGGWDRMKMEEESLEEKIRWMILRSFIMEWQTSLICNVPAAFFIFLECIRKIPKPGEMPFSGVSHCWNDIPLVVERERNEKNTPKYRI